MKKKLLVIFLCIFFSIMQGTVVSAAADSFNCTFGMDQSAPTGRNLKQDAEQKAYFTIINSSGTNGVNIYLASVRLDNPQIRSEWAVVKVGGITQRVNAGYRMYAAPGYYYGLVGRVSVGSANVMGRFTP